MPTAIVTGASSGIGLGVARALATRGYNIVANSRSMSEDHPSVREIGAEAIAIVPGDVADGAVARRLANEAVSRFGGIDLLVNNAGIFIAKPFTSYTDDDFDRLVRTNVRGFFRLTQLVVGRMIEQGRGHIVTVTWSGAENSLRAVPSVLPTIGKAGLNGATRALAIELADKGVRVNAVAPGIVRTPMHPPETHEFLKTLHPMPRLGDVEDVVRGVLYLEDAPFVTGEILHVDGGAYTGRW